MSDLQKLFVLVPSKSAATVESIKTASLSTNKVYFMAKYNQIVAKGAVYGVDPSTGTELESLVTVIGGTKGADGTVTVDFSNMNYYSAAKPTIIGAIKALDAKIKTELDKLAGSKTLNENYEFTGQIKYVAAVPAAEGKDAVPAHIALVDEAGTELSTIAVSDIIGNGVLKTSAYDAATGILTLTFAQADGITKAVEVDLKAMLDINDISIAEASKNYLEVTLGAAGTEGDTQAVFGAKVKKIVGAGASADLTGLADAADVKAYVDSKATDLAVKAEGDKYITAGVDSADNKKIKITADVQNVTYTKGTHATYNADGGKATEAVAANIAGVADSLVDGAQATTAIKSYVDFVAAEEALRADAKVLAAVKGLDKASATVDGTNVHVTYKEDDGIVTVESVSEDYATVNHTASTSSAAAPKTDASISVAKGDEAKLIKASDLANVAAYAADKAAEEAHRVDKKIKDLTGSATSGAVAGVTTTVTTSGGQVSGVVVEVANNDVTFSGDKGARDLTVASAANVIKGSAIAAIKDYVDNVVADNSTDLAVTAEGDDYVSASVNKGNNKHVIVASNVTELSFNTPTSGNSTLIGTTKSLVDAADVASKVSSFVNKRIDEEIKKLDLAEQTTGDSNVEIKYSETDGKVAVSAAVKYATVAYNKAENAAATLSVTNGDQLAKGNDIASLKQYVDSHVTEAVAALNSSVVEKDASEFVTVTTGIANGKLNADTSSVAVVYAAHTADHYTNGVATGDFVNLVLGDLWEEYKG